MEYDSLFTQTRWQILKFLSEKPYSPLELAKLTNSTVSHASQQLKFLEAMGIVKKEKVSNRDKGKPRMLFSLTKDLSYIIFLGDSFSGKKLLGLDENKKAILKIWFFEDVNKHYLIEKFYWKIEDNLKDILTILIKNKSEAVEIVIVTEDVDKLKTRIQGIINKIKEETDFSCSIIEPKEFGKKYSAADYYEIYDPVKFFRNIIIKGGEK